MQSKSMIIIGAGIAGLSAGCYAQMNGYRTQIFEMHTIPGGLCTSWKRSGFTIDGCLQYLIGTHPGSAHYRMWQELGVIENRRFYNREEFARVESGSGQTLVFYTDANRLEAHLKKLSPQDARPIEQFCNAIRSFTRMEMPLDISAETFRTPEGARLGLHLLAHLLPTLKWSHITVGQFAARFKHPFLREALPLFMQFPMPEMPMLVLIMTLANLHKRNAGYPLGGSLRLAVAIARRYRELGGEIRYRSRVERILVEKDRAVGIRLEDGSEYFADLVVSAADGHATHFNLLDQRYLDRQTRAAYQNLPVFHPILQISLGVNRDFSQEGESVSFPLHRPVTIAGKRCDRLILKHYAYDSSLAPAGKTVATVMLESDYEFWRRLADDRQAYQDEKQRVVETILDQLEIRYPGIREQIEMIDVATPLTYERYTGNWRGSIMGWAISPAKIRLMMGKGMSKTQPGLSGFYRIGQWVEPGGSVPHAAAAGRSLIARLSAEEKRPFRTSLPGPIHDISHQAVKSPG